MELIREIFGLEIKISNNIYLEQFKIIIENIDNKCYRINSNFLDY